MGMKLIFKMKTSFLVFSTLCLLLVEQSLAEKINSIATHTSDCIFCGMVEGVGYLTVKVCGSTDCCLSSSLGTNDHVDWLPGNTDTFAGDGLLECAKNESGVIPLP